MRLPPDSMATSASKGPRYVTQPAFTEEQMEYLRTWVRAEIQYAIAVATKSDARIHRQAVAEAMFEQMPHVLACKVGGKQ